MAHDIERLKREIEELEKQIASHPFEGLFDRKRADQLQDKLKKKRKELARLQSGESDLEEHEHGEDHPDVHEFIGSIEETPDLGPDFPMGIDADEPQPRPKAAKPPVGAVPLAAKTVARVSPAAKPVAKKAAKAVKKTAAKAKPKAKPQPKPKPKPKAAAKKKAAAKPAKKKGKR